jgi:arabinan endo-1,5-alpha-L-arabinosidase
MVAGDNLQAGTFQIESVRTGTVLELAVEGFPVGGRPVRRPPPPNISGNTPPAPGTGAGIFAGIGKPIPNQDVAEVSAKWQAGNVDVRMANYMLQAQQKWNIEPVPEAGGYLGAPYFKITIAGTNRTLTATEGGELIALPEFAGKPEQLWRFDQLADGSWRIMPKAVPNTTQPLALSAVGSSFATLAKFDPSGEKQRWLIKMP